MPSKIVAIESVKQPPSITHEHIQRTCAGVANTASGLKTANNPTVGGLTNFYSKVKATRIYLNSYTSDTRLHSYANDIHPDVGYNMSEAISEARTAYNDYLVWFRDNIDKPAGIAEWELVSGDVVKKTPYTIGLDAVLDAIIATVE